MIYRMDIRYPANRGGVGTKFRIILTADDGQSMTTLHTAHSSSKPTREILRQWLAVRGFEAYGDMLTVGGTTIRSMVKKIS